MVQDVRVRARERIVRLPRGGALAEETWWARHRAITLIAWGHLPLLLLVGRANGIPIDHLIFEVGLIGLAATLASVAAERFLASAAATFALVTSSALLVHFSQGLIEMHFHFFVVVAIITLYQDWRPYLLGLGYVVVHHGLFGTIQPHDVYNHPAALANPRLWAVIHGVFILGASAAGIVNWRFNEKMAGRLTESLEQLAEREARFRSLIQNSFDVVAVVDANLRFTYVSSAVGAAYEGTPEELIGTCLMDLVHPSDAAIARGALHDLVNDNRESASFEVRIRGAADSWRWIEVRATDHLSDEVVAGIVLNYHDVTARRSIQEESTTLAALVAASPDAILRLTPEGIITSWNRGATELYGYGRDEIIGRHVGVLVPQEFESQFEDVTQQVLAGATVPAFDSVRLRKGGGRVDVSLTMFPLCDPDGSVTGLASIARDMTERNTAQEAQESLQTQLRQAQKMHSIGQLAGGIAHDFNNILAIISNYATFLRDGVSDPDQQEDLDEILKASKRGAALIRQLLLFSRKEVSQPEHLDIDSMIGDAGKLLSRSLGEDVVLELDLDGSLPSVFIDRTQLDQILINLAVNARDAMPTGGRFSISTSLQVLDDEVTQIHPEMAPGSYVCITFSDTGQGMARDVQEQIFDPFFTTKQRGEGTGLGLATVYGIVKQAGGYIYVYSEPRKGTSFRVYLPPSLDRAKTEPHDVSLAAAPAAGGTETILVVEDDRALREMVRRILSGSGYEVVVAADPNEAIATAERLDRLDLLLTDVVMPVMTGRALADAIQRTRGTVPVIFMSGYTSDVITHRGELDEGVKLVQKPFSSRELLDVVRQALDAPPAELPPSANAVSILIVDDEPVFRDFLKVVIEDMDRSIEVRVAGSGHDALRAIESRRPEIVLVDSLSAPMTGQELAERLRLQPQPPALIAVTAGTPTQERPWADAVVQKGARMIDELGRLVEEYR